MADYEVLAPGGHENLINNVTERLDEKAYIDGYYAQLTAGAADSLTGRGDGVSASYLYRTTGGDADVADGTATVKSIHGRTLVWNQMVKNGNFPNVSEWESGVQVTMSASGGMVTLMQAGNTSYIAFQMKNKTVTAKANHKHLIMATVSCSSGKILFVPSKVSTYGYTQLTGITSETRVSWMWTPSSDADFYAGIRFPVTTSGTAEDLTATIRDYMCIDLTAMFGAGNEPSTVAEFEAMYPDAYYPYDAGSLLSVQMEGIETVGFNQWDEEWELGDISSTTGQNTSASTTIRCKNMIPVLPATSYYFKSPKNGFKFFYDADGSFIGRTDMSANQTFTTPSNAHFMRFRMWSEYGTTYNHDICINLSWSGYRNGEYEPYWQSERTIPAATYFPNGMRSAGTVYDELTADEAIVRVGEVDLGTLTWTYNSTAPNTEPYFFSSAITGAKPVTTNSLVGDISCSKYETYSTNTVTRDGVEGISINATSALIVHNSSYTDVATLKAAMQGVMLHYALATPVVTPIDPPLNLTYRVSDFGTERIMILANEQSAAPTQQVVYGLNVVDTVRRLPTEYISHDSFTQFRLALGAKLGIFIVETWDENDGRYEYTINDA